MQALYSLSFLYLRKVMIGDRHSANTGISQVLSKEMGGQSLHIPSRFLVTSKGLANSFFEQAKINYTRVWSVKPETTNR